MSRPLAASEQAFGWRAGRLSAVGRRGAYPLRLSRAAAMTADRSVLVGNAAQALHPVAGQGFNLGLRDAAMLALVVTLFPFNTHLASYSTFWGAFVRDSRR